MVVGGTGSVKGGTGLYLVALGQYRAVLIDTEWYWVSKGRYWLVVGGIGSVKGSTCWYLMVLGQYRAILVGT